MKWGVLVLISLLTMVSVSASYVPEPGIIFKIKKTNCTNNGTITLDITHEGGVVRYSDIIINATNEELKIPLTGNWFYPDNYRIPENYTESDIFYESKLKFKTTNNIFTKGKYLVTLSWPSDSNNYGKTREVIECPGIVCKTNDDCILQQSCVNSICEWVSCPPSQFANGHICLNKCEDHNACTQDYYTDEGCVYVKIQGCCNNNEECEKEKECLDQKCKIKGKNIFERFWNWLKSRY